MTKDGSVLPRQPLTGAILAGGRARRLGGRDKSALVVDGRPILDRQLAALRDVCSSVVIVANDPERYRDAGVPVVGDAPGLAGAGPMAGICTALRAASTPQVLVVACDMPYVTGALLAHLAGRGRGADAAIPRVGGRLHPLCAAYAISATTRLERRVRAGRCKVQDALAELDVVLVDEDEVRRFGDPVRLLANVNTPGDLQALVAPSLTGS